MNIHRTACSCIILAGGEGRRVGGNDKGLLPYKNKRLIEHVIERMSPQVTDIVISANRNIETYQSLCHEKVTVVVADQAEHYLGPLSGITACLPHCQNRYVLVVACDMPLLPDNLATKLSSNIAQHEIIIASVKQRHQLVLLIKKSVLPSLQQALNHKQLKLIQWVESQDYCQLAFDEQVQSFANMNTLNNM